MAPMNCLGGRSSPSKMATPAGELRPLLGQTAQRLQPHPLQPRTHRTGAPLHRGICATGLQRKQSNLHGTIARYREGDRTHIEYLHQVPADTPQESRNLWFRKQDPTTGAVTVTSAAEDPWDLDVILTLPTAPARWTQDPGCWTSTPPW